MFSYERGMGVDYRWEDTGFLYITRDHYGILYVIIIILFYCTFGESGSLIGSILSDLEERVYT